MENERPVPLFVTLTHLAFMAWTVAFAHYPPLFIGGFLFSRFAAGANAGPSGTATTAREADAARAWRVLSWSSLGASLLALAAPAFKIEVAAIALAPAGFWVGAAQSQGVPDYQKAFAAVFGQGLWTIGGSLVAFLVGQLIDVSVFHRIRRATGERLVWLRATGSTAVSQLVDSFIVLYIAFVLGPQQWPTSLWLAVGTMNYGYKMACAIALIPMLYLMRRGITAWLGRDQAGQLRAAASRG